jgi:DNA primase
MSETVKDLLKLKNIPFNQSGQDYLVKCLNPEHNDSNPSCRIDKVTGVTHCFSCGFKTNIFKFFGILSNNTSVRIAKLKEKIRQLSEQSNGLELPEGAKPWTSKFRGISVDTLKYYEAFYTDREPDLEDRIVFPVKDITGKIVVFQARHTLSDGQPKYVFFPKERPAPLYPALLPERSSSLVLVEGIFDLINLYDKGLKNAVCTFGTSKLYKDTASKLLTYKVMGVEKIFILYDGDDAGREAAKKLKPLIEEAEFITEIISLPDDMDPGSLDQEYVDSLIEYTR